MALQTSATMTSAPFQMPLEYYELPSSSEALFSTHCGREKKRLLPSPPPLVLAPSDYDRHFYAKVASLEKEFPDLCAVVVQEPKGWYDLYKYFDAVDLWVLTPSFCCQVVKYIFSQNIETIESYAKEWIVQRQHLIASAPIEVPLIHASPQLHRDLAIEFSDMTEDQCHCFMQYLDVHRQALLSTIRRPPHAGQAIQIVDRSQTGLQSSPVPMHPVHPFASLHDRPEQRHVSVGRPQSHQQYAHVMESQRDIVTSPNNLPLGPRGLSNASLQNARRYSNRFYPTNTRYGNNAAMSRGSPPRQGNGDPVYVYNNRRSPPQGQRQNSNVVKSHWDKSRSNSPTSSPEAHPYPPHPPLFSVSYPQTTIQNNINSSPPRYRQASGSLTTQSQTAARGFNNPIPASNISPAKSLDLAKSPNSTKNANSVNIPDPFKGTQLASSTGPDKSLNISSNIDFASTRGPLSNDARVLEAVEKREHLNLESQAKPERKGTAKKSESFNLNSRVRLEKDRAVEKCVPFDLESQAKLQSNGAVTYFYISGVRSIPREDSQPRTVFVRYINRQLFESHKLKELMSECGVVDTVTYLAGQDGAADAGFVAFEDHGSVRRAIERWNGVQLLPGTQSLVVDYATRRDSNNGPRGFDDANRRERQARGNYAPGFPHQSSINTVIRYDPNVPYIPGSSHSRRSSGLETMGFPVGSQSHSRHSSAGHIPQAQVGFPRGAIGIPVGSQLNSSLAEVAQHQFALNRFKGTQAPVEHIVNHKNVRYQAKEHGAMDGPLAQLGLDRKENFPLTSPHKTPSRNKSKRKYSRQNTPTRPTPASSPSRPGSGHIEQKLTVEVPKGQKKKYNSKKKSTSSKSEAATAGFNARDVTLFTTFKSNTPKVKLGDYITTSTSFKSNVAIAGSVDSEAISPTATERTEDTGTCVNSTDTSFSTSSSRKPSDTVSDQEESRHPGSQNDMVGSENTKTEMTSKPTINNNKAVPSNSDRAKPETKGQNINRSPARESDSNVILQVAPDSTPKANGVKSESRENDSLAPKEPVSEVIIINQTEWPALDPAKSSASSIADGKRPPPPTIRPPTNVSSGDRKTDKDSNKNKKVRRAVPIIAIPRTFQPRSQSAKANDLVVEEEHDICCVASVQNGHKTDSKDDTLGSRDWPYVINLPKRRLRQH